MNKVEQTIETKSNDLVYMQRYLKIALDIEADVIVWEDALNTHRAHLESTRNEIKKLNNAKKYSADFNQTKADKRTGILTAIEIFKAKIKDEEKREKRSFLIKAGICVSVFVILTLVFYFAGVGNGLAREMMNLENPTFFAELCVSASIAGFIICVICIFMFLIPSSYPSYSIEYQENIKKLKKQLEELSQAEKKTIESDVYVDRTLPQVQKKQSYLLDMINRIEYNLDESKRVRAMIYSDGVLPEKYRNIVCVASLYQFLINGICTQIKGHGGIYDTYEYHLKLKDIVNNLVEIRRDLRRIQANQEFLYDKLCDVHETLTNINEGIDRAEKEISSNAAMVAESVKRTAIAEEWRNREIWYRS